MNQKGHPPTLVAAHPGNFNAAKSGAHSPRLIQARAQEIVESTGIWDELDEAGQIVLIELGRLNALIEAIDLDLDKRGVTDRNGKERYLLQRRERYSKRLIEVNDRLLESLSRSRTDRARSQPGEVTGEQMDYVGELQRIALGHDPKATIRDRLVALKLLVDLGVKGTTSFYHRVEATIPYPDDPEFQAEVRRLQAELEEARKQGYLQQLRDQRLRAALTGE